MNKYLSAEEQVKTLQKVIIKSRERWLDICQNGTDNTVLEDGYAMNMLRVIIVYCRKKLLQICEENSIDIPDEYNLPVPPKFNNSYTADTLHKDVAFREIPDIKECKCGGMPHITQEGNYYRALCHCGRFTNRCNSQEHAIFCWNNNFVGK